MRRGYFIILFVVFLLAAFLVMGWDSLLLLYYGFRSFLRMIAAYALSVIFSVTLALLITHNKRLSAFLFPVLDVLQSVPILGFLPFAILFFVHVFPGGLLGQEFSSIFLIFTGMAWAIAFSIVESASYITNDMRDLAKLLNLRGFRYLTNIVFPISLPQFVSSSMTGWGGGWYFLVASEYITLGTENIMLPGLGSFIAKSAFSYNLLWSLFGLLMLAFIVIGINLYVWQPLLKKSRGTLEKADSSFIVESMEWMYAQFSSFGERFQSRSEKIMDYFSINPENSWKKNETLSTASYFIMACILALFLYLLFFRLPNYLDNLLIFRYMLSSLGRIAIGYVIALVWTAAIAIFLARNKRAMAILMPLFDLGQSIPAISVFPIVVVLVVQTLGGQLGLNVASILLLLTGMQWYFVFNLVRAVQTIPEEISDLSSLLRLDTLQKLRNIMIPAILPAIFIASVESIGGGWNASIVSEYITGPGGKVFEMEGLGFLLSSSAANANMDGILLAVSGITLIVLSLNYFIWKPLIRGSDRYRF
ncbi:MAG: ABC transporter permease subunit [Candidatus ainarchaeum sp.]|nr:ABC transporter permease subunit [Candidatus ainarchaeum sp.]